MHAQAFGTTSLRPTPGTGPPQLPAVREPRTATRGAAADAGAGRTTKVPLWSSIARARVGTAPRGGAFPYGGTSVPRFIGLLSLLVAALTLAAGASAQAAITITHSELNGSQL